jgi:gas vesicle protein
MEGLKVNENPQVNGTPGGSGSSMAMGLVLGAVVGAGIALLLAPASGRETRGRLADAGRRWGGAALDKLDQARTTVTDLKQDATSALEAGREAFEHGQKSHVPRPAPRTDPQSQPVNARSSDTVAMPGNGPGAPTQRL